MLKLVFFFPFSRCFDKYNCEPYIHKYFERTDADLIQVQIVSRHGARTPLHLSPKLSNIWTCSNTELSSQQRNVSNFIHAHVSFGRSVFNGNCHFGQLIGKGVESLNRMGVYLRNIYVHQMKFLPSKYHSKVMKLRSTHTLRTIHSQMAIINGLYPGEKNVIIETADKNYDPWRRTSLVCPKLKFFFENLTGTSEWISMGLQNETIMRSFEEKLGIKWNSVHDIATSAMCQKLPLPPNITESMIDDALRLKSRQHQYLYNHDKIFPLFFGFQAADLLNEMLDRINGKSSKKFIHWSAHDGNINAFLGYLGYVDSVWPPYGSFITIELLKFRKEGTLFLQFRYNGRIIRIPRFSFNKIIPFSEFQKFVNDHIPTLFEDCGFNNTDFRFTDTSISDNF